MNGELRIGFFACKPINKGDELTFDYQFQTFGEKQQKCYCGTEKCRGFLSSKASNSSNFDQLWDESDDADSVENEQENDTDEENSHGDGSEDHERCNGKHIQKKKKQIVKKNYNKHDDLDVCVGFDVYFVKIF